MSLTKSLGSPTAIIQLDVGEERGNMSEEPELTGLPPRLAGRFALGELIGRGVTSRVHRAHDTLLDRPAAVKVFPVAGDARSRREVRLLAALDHPGLVPVYDVDEVDGHAVVVTALYEGGSLADRLADGPLEPGDALLVVASVADALDHVHRSGVLHRAVTPSNVLFDDDGRAHLSDFGVALVTDAPRITDTGDVVGEAGYLAPEQIRGDGAGPPADVYALGLVLVESLSGRRAFPGESTPTGRLERGPEVPEDLPGDVGALVSAMTDADPAARPRADEVTLVLRRAALASEPEPVAVLPAPRRPMRGRGVLVAGGVVMSVALAGTVVFASTRPVHEISATLPPAAVTMAPAAPAAPARPSPDEESGSESSSSSDQSSSSDSGSGSSADSSGSSGSFGSRSGLLAEGSSGRGASGFAALRGESRPAQQAPSTTSTPAPSSSPAPSTSPSASSSPASPSSSSESSSESATTPDDADQNGRGDDTGRDGGLVGGLLGDSSGSSDDSPGDSPGDSSHHADHRTTHPRDERHDDGQGLLGGLL